MKDNDEINIKTNQKIIFYQAAIPDIKTCVNFHVMKHNLIDKNVLYRTVIFFAIIRSSSELGFHTFNFAFNKVINTFLSSHLFLLYFFSCMYVSNIYSWIKCIQNTRFNGFSYRGENCKLVRFSANVLGCRKFCSDAGSSMVLKFSYFVILI